MAVCANKNCRCPLSATGRSRDNSTYCADCGDFVWAMRPNRELLQDWYLVSTETPVPGTVILADQCEGCGLSAYTVEQESRHMFAAVCAGQEIDGQTHKGCGERHPIRSKMSKDVIF